MSEIDRYLGHSAKIEIDDLDWAEAARVGLTDDEKFILTYFADIEGQTIVYLKQLLQSKLIEDPEVIAFLSMWNYEEYFHGHALSRLLAACGAPLERGRIANVRKRSRFLETWNALGAMILSRVFSDSFPAVYMAWGAINELTTLCGYEAVIEQTANPVLRTLAERIAKQERRHFAWYFNSAEQRLRGSKTARFLARTILSRSWTPVGDGVKGRDEVLRLVGALFRGPRKWAMAEVIDHRTATLPGLEGIDLMTRFLRRNFQYGLEGLVPGLPS